MSDEMAVKSDGDVALPLTVETLTVDVPDVGPEREMVSYLRLPRAGRRGGPTRTPDRDAFRPERGSLRAAKSGMWIATLDAFDSRRRPGAGVPERRSYRWLRLAEAIAHEDSTEILDLRETPRA